MTRLENQQLLTIGQRSFQENLRTEKEKNRVFFHPHNEVSAACSSFSPQAAEKAGMSTAQAQHFLEKIPTEPVKNKLRETTEAACKYGVSNSICFPSPCLKREKSCCPGWESSWLLAAFLHCETSSGFLNPSSTPSP